MRCSKSIDYAACRRLLTTLSKYLRSKGTSHLVSSAIAHARGSVELPSLSLFSEGGRHRPSTWMLPRLKCDHVALVYAYEAFAAQALGVTSEPGKAPEDALFNEGAGNVRRSLNRSIDARNWFAPGVRLVALAQQFPESEVVADFETNTFSASVGDAFFKVAPDSVYSNFISDDVAPSLPARDIEQAAFCLPPVKTDCKVFVAVSNMVRGLGQDGLRMVRGLHYCVEQGLTTTLDIEQALQRRSPGRQLLKAASETAARDEAMQAAMLVLDRGGVGLTKRLYDAVVPVLFSSRDFTRRFGTPNADSTRGARESTREKWAEIVVARANLGD